ncbi:MAG: PAS domain S-box protein [Acidobacteria bacterium]|nr:PAS domain S-box protein [Acidobacteriota bacterium]
MNKAKLFAVLAITIGLVVLGVLNLRDRLASPAVADDGVEWVNTAKGLRAKAVRPDVHIAVRKGDFLRAVYYKGKYEEVDNPETVSRYLQEQGVGNDARYVIERKNHVLQSIYRLDEPLYDVDFKVTTMPQNLGRGLYLAFIGIVYLAIGLFVLFRQNRAALTYHFFGWFLISFVVYFFSPTRVGNQFDIIISFLDASALALLAPLFLHFCANFPSDKPLFRRSRFLASLLYFPAFALVTFEALWHFAPTVYTSSALGLVGKSLDNIELIHYAAFFAIGNALLIRTFIKAQRPLLRQQLKWIVWGLGLSVLPFVALYLVPYISNIEIPPIIETLAYVPLILIPVSFGYSIVRYRLMDVDVIMRRSFVHVLATLVVGAIYMAVLLGVGDLVKFIWATADLNSWKTRSVLIVGMLIVTMLFAPIKNKLQIWADRWFYGESYSLRTGLQDFGRTLAQTTALPQLLDSLVRRLSSMLSVRKIAIFIEDANSPSGFRLAHASEIDSDISLPNDIKNIIRMRAIGRGFISANDLTKEEAWSFEALLGGSRAYTTGALGLRQTTPFENGADLQALDLSYADFNPASATERLTKELYYFVPCVVRDRMVAILCVGRTTSGALLTSEDTELLRALSGYVAVAIDNSVLYRSEIEKAGELARLKEFSENIIESVNVGILVVDVEGRITTWNSALETMMGIARDRALRRSIHDVLDNDLIETLQNVSGQENWALRQTRHIYKYNAATEDGRPLTLNISLAPFEAARGIITGTLIVLENVTERAHLEKQLLEREKLSSIGLLAAGVAHEVNTPLAGISSYAQMLIQQIPANDPKHKLLEKIHVQTLRASGIVNNLLNFSRTGDSDFREVNINQVLDDTIQLLEPQLRNSRVDIVRHYGPELIPAHGNASKLQQVFMNLILNARDAMPEGGRLTIQTRMVETSLVIDLRDTGQGIKAENIARIYDPFFTTKDVGQGTGLGLAISYGIIQEHGGRIFVESRLNEGAHFTIKLPTAYARQMQAASD